MSRYIDADALVEDIKRRRLIFKDTIEVHEALSAQGKAIRRAIDEAPTADVQEVRHGHWIIRYSKNVDHLGEFLKYEGDFCSICGEMGDGKYCSECGAKMDEEEQE